MRLILLQNRRAEIPRVRLLPLSTLHVQHRRLKRAAKRRRLFRLSILSPPQLLNRVVKIRIKIAPQLTEVRPTRAQNPLTVRIVQERIEQVLEREIRMPTRHRLAVRDREHNFNSCGKQRSSFLNP